jgi:hypothetical protein
MMRLSLLVVAAGLLLSQQAVCRPSLSQEGRAAFREAVADYQLFVVPHCDPVAVRAYVAARADRDRAFVQSLRGTLLATDFNDAIAARTKQDSRTFYECSLPPPPPPPPPGWVPAPAPKHNKAPPRDPLVEHFKEGDRQYQEMVRLRQQLIGSTSRQ